jgi:hypothetical protein
MTCFSQICSSTFHTCTGYVVAAARDAEEGLMSATRAFDRERTEALEVKAAAAGEAARRDAEIADLTRRLAETTAVGPGGLCRAGTYPKSHAPMLAKVPKIPPKYPK